MFSSERTCSKNKYNEQRISKIVIATCPVGGDQAKSRHGCGKSDYLEPFKKVRYWLIESSKSFGL